MTEADPRTCILWNHEQHHCHGKIAADYGAGQWTQETRLVVWTFAKTAHLGESSARFPSPSVVGSCRGARRMRETDSGSLLRLRAQASYLRRSFRNHDFAG